jgi:hypothetical protein
MYQNILPRYIVIVHVNNIDQTPTALSPPPAYRTITFQNITKDEDEELQLKQPTGAIRGADRS